MNPEISVSPSHIINIADEVIKAEFSPFEWSQNLLCIALPNKIIVASIRFPEDDEELDADPEYLELEKFSQKHRTLAIAWSPETSLNVFPKTVAFCSAASDHKLRLYNSDLAVNSTVQELRGHTDYINAVAYDPYGEYVVSTSDDHTCRVWSLKELPGQCITNIRLLSPGMSVACHQSEEGKLLVGEKCGVLSLFNLVSGQAILSFDSNRSPLLSADWSPNTSLYAVAVVAGEIVIWDTTNPRWSQCATTQVSDSACDLINHSPCACRVDRQRYSLSSIPHSRLLLFIFSTVAHTKLSLLHHEWFLSSITPSPVGNVSSTRGRQRVCQVLSIEPLLHSNYRPT